MLLPTAALCLADGQPGSQMLCVSAMPTSCCCRTSAATRTSWIAIERCDTDPVRPCCCRQPTTMPACTCTLCLRALGTPPVHASRISTPMPFFGKLMVGRLGGCSATMPLHHARFHPPMSWISSVEAGVQPLLLPFS